MNCWFCGDNLIWQSDFNYDEVFGSGEGIVTYLICPNCNANVQCCIRHDDDV